VAVGARLRVEYEGEGLESYLPRSGQVMAQLSDASGNGDWLLLALDEPMNYQLKVGEPYQFRALEIGHFLLRSRVVGQPLGQAQPTSAFVLLVEESRMPITTPFDEKQYPFVAWASCVPEP